jgi:L-2-hydroxyglutarate oxidase LhgO
MNINKYKPLLEIKSQVKPLNVGVGLSKEEKDYLNELIENMQVIKCNISQEEADKIAKILPKVKFPKGETWLDFGKLRANHWTSSIRDSYDITIEEIGNEWERGGTKYVVMDKVSAAKIEFEEKSYPIPRTDYLLIDY